MYSVESRWKAIRSVRSRSSHINITNTCRARSGFDSLRAIHAEDPNLSKEIELYVDGGIRRGTDALMAVALGAKGVGLGRTFLYAQAAYGEKGAIRAIRSE